jgi:hypothetical protein
VLNQHTVVQQPQHDPTGMRSNFAVELDKEYINYRDERGRVIVVLRVCGECSVTVRIEPISHYPTPQSLTLSNLTPFDLTLHHHIPPYPSSLHPTSAHLHRTPLPAPRALLDTEVQDPRVCPVRPLWRFSHPAL